MGKKKEYKEANRRFLKKLSFQEGVCALPCGIYYKVLETGERLMVGCLIILMSVLVPMPYVLVM